MPASRRDVFVIWLAVCAIFLASLLLSPGYLVNGLYVGPVLLAMRRGTADSLTYQTAAAATVAVAVHAVLVRDPAPASAVLFNRLVIVIGIWLAAVIARRSRGETVRREAASSARHEAEVALRRRDKDLEDVKYALDQSAIVATTNVAGDITYVNDKFCEISKYSREELVGRNHRILNSGLHSLEFFREMYRTIGSGRVWRGEIRNRAKDGSIYWVDTTIVPFVDARNHPYQYVAIRYDITDRKASEAKLREQASLAQVGKMAAVVAHEVRNPLAGIRGAVQVIGRRLPAGSTEQGIAQEIVNRIDTLNNIVQDLLQFARPREPVLQTVTADALIRETVRILEQDPKFANVSVRVESADATLSADTEQLKLVLSNLIINAAQAMNGEGEIVVSARAHSGWHELRVADTGPGIAPDTLERIFEPFFTTKHRGTGLGLPTARRILEAHGGSLALESEPGRGTTAVVRLPAVGVPAAERSVGSLVTSPEQRDGDA
jgi:PAS domain S-box-containing protein